MPLFNVADLLHLRASKDDDFYSFPLYRPVRIIFPGLIPTSRGSPTTRKYHARTLFVGQTSGT
jgi:hypothetical protein